MLLRRFAKDERLVMVARTGGGAQRLTTVKNACKQVGYHRIEAEDMEEWARGGHDPEQVEKVEGRGSPLGSEGVAAFQHELFHGSWRVVMPQGTAVMESDRFVHEETRVR